MFRLIILVAIFLAVYPMIGNGYEQFMNDFSINEVGIFVSNMFNGFVSFILIGIALVTIVYWTGIIKKMVVTNKPIFATRDTESKNWVYDLIKGDQETVFVAEVPGPEDKIMVRLIDKVLYVRGSQGFSKEVPIEGTIEMEIADFKNRYGVLTLRIKNL